MWRALIIVVPAAVSLAQDLPPYTIEKVIANLQHASALAWSREGYLLAADLPAAKITKVDGEGTTIFREGVPAAGIELDQDGRMYLSDPHEHRITRTDKKGKSETIADKFDGKRLNGPGRLALTKNGHLYFTDSAFATADKQKELGFYGIYHVPPKGEPALIAKLTGRPSGVALSPDHKTLYVTDSDNRSVIAWDIDKSGAASNQREFVKVSDGVPAGIVSGADGKIYVAARKVEVFTPAGKPVGAIELNEKPGDMVFGEAGENTLFIAARTSVYRVRFPDKGGKGH